MAHFRGTVVGSNGIASRLGSKNSGLDVEANGWTTGVTVQLYHNEKKGIDCVKVWRTSGSYGDNGKSQLIAEWEEKA